MAPHETESMFLAAPYCMGSFSENAECEPQKVYMKAKYGYSRRKILVNKWRFIEKCKFMAVFYIEKCNFAAWIYIEKCNRICCTEK